MKTQELLKNITDILKNSKCESIEVDVCPDCKAKVKLIRKLLNCCKS